MEFDIKYNYEKGKLTQTGTTSFRHDNDHIVVVGMSIHVWLRYGTDKKHVELRQEICAVNAQGSKSSIYVYWDHDQKWDDGTSMPFEDEEYSKAMIAEAGSLLNVQIFHETL